MCQIPARVRRFSGGGRGVVCSRAEGKFALSITLEDMGYAVMFEDGQVLIHSEGADTQDAAVRLGIREGMMYKVLGQACSRVQGDLGS
jgi:hypothetical protein